MSLMNEELARAQMSARLGEAQQNARAQNLIRARRLSRKAEKAAQQARLALARVLLCLTLIAGESRRPARVPGRADVCSERDHLRLVRARVR